jgi:cellulose synthase/poly-beta-1,6-N-acetylglucosamine synthase-like glycosyltransferase
MFGRAGSNRIGGNVLISGAIGLFPRTLLISAGGYQRSMAEDMELTIRLRRRARELGQPDHLVFVADAVSFTEVPESIEVLGRQRMRWQGGCTECLVRHRRLFLNRRYGVLGMFMFPAFAIVEGLAPIAEAVGILTTVVGLANGSIAPSTALLFVTVTYGLGMLLSVGGMLLEELYYRSYGTVGDRLRLLVAALAEMFWYHPLTLVWRLRGLVQLARGRVEWGVIERRGFQSEDG